MPKNTKYINSKVSASSDAFVMSHVKHFMYKIQNMKYKIKDTKYSNSKVSASSHASVTSHVKHSMYKIQKEHKIQ